MNKKILGILSVSLAMLILCSTLGLALPYGAYSVRQAPSESRQINFYSNGATGSGLIISGMNGNSRITYSFEQKCGLWISTVQVGRTRGLPQFVNVNYNPITGSISVPQLSLNTNVVSVA